MTTQRRALTALIAALIAALLAGCGPDSQEPGASTNGSAPPPAAGTAPAAPQLLRVGSPSASGLLLTWIDASADESSFQVERAAAEAGPFTVVSTLAAGTQSHVDTVLAPATRYYYRVRAVNSVGGSAPSNVDTAATLAVPTSVPNAPMQLVAADPSSQSLRLIWTDASNNETGFRVERSTSPNGAFTSAGVAGADATSLTVSGLSPATSHYFRVQAANSAGSSDFSNIAAGTTLAAPQQPPSAPSSLAAMNIGSSSLVLTWTDTSENESGFEVERGSAQGTNFVPLANLPANTPRYQVQGLSPQTTYQFRLRAINAAGASLYTAAVSATTLPTPTLPAAPTDLTVGSATVNSLKLAWVDRSDNELGFRIERSASASSGFVLIASTLPGVREYTDPALAASRTYYYRVQAVSAVGVSAYTPAVPGTTAAPPPTVPAAPDSLTVESTASGSLSLQWADRSTDEALFEIERRASSQIGYTQVATVLAGATSWVNTGLVSSNTYFYRVRARNAAGASGWSNVASGVPNGGVQTITLSLVANNVVVESGWDGELANKANPHTYPAVGMDRVNFCVLNGPCELYSVKYRSAVQFDIAMLAGKTIESASLQLRVQGKSASAPLPAGANVAPKGILVGAIASPWSPTDLTWNRMANPQVMLYYPYQSLINPSAPGQAVALDLTDVVRAWAAGAIANNGLDLRSTNYDPVSFESREADYFELPTLVVSYR